MLSCDSDVSGKIDGVQEVKSSYSRRRTFSHNQSGHNRRVISTGLYPNVFVVYRPVFTEKRGEGEGRGSELTPLQWMGENGYRGKAKLKSPQNFSTKLKDFPAIEAVHTVISMCCSILDNKGQSSGNRELFLLVELDNF